MNATVRRIPLDFPDTPAIGDIFTATSGVRYEWDGTVWIVGPPLVPPVVVETDPLSLHLTGGTLTGEAFAPIMIPSTDAGLVTRAYVDQLVTQVVGIAAYIGAADASTADCQCVFTRLSGVPDGPLPPANQFPVGAHLIVAVGGMPTTGPAAGVAFTAGDWIISDNVLWYRVPFGGANVFAGNVAVTPTVAGGDDVQEVLTNLQAQKVAKAGDTMTGGLTMRGPTSGTPSGDVRFNSGSNNAYMGRFYTTQSGYNTRPETVLHFEQTCGGYSTQDVFRTGTDSPPFFQTMGRVIVGGSLTVANTINLNGGQFVMTGNSANAIVVQSDSQKYFDFRRGNGTTRWRIDTNNSADDYLSIRANTNAGTFDQVIYINRQSWNEWLYGDHSATSHTNRSDIRLKQDIAPVLARDAANAFEHLQPVRYRQKIKEGYPGDGETVKWGFVADEIEAGAPSAVSVDDDGMKGYDIAQVLVIAVAKIKELEDKVLSLEARLA
jgi:hypothetical protein